VRMISLEKKLETSVKQQNKPRNTVVDFEKIFYETVREITKAKEKPACWKTSRRLKRGKIRLRDRIVQAETWSERDQIVKSLAAKCYDIAQKFSESDPDRSLKWMKVVARLLAISFTPKKNDDLELIKKEIAKLKEQAAEIEQLEETDVDASD